jgi:GDP/UDP-N,N'-diacetylbacillosamine 2-epimerase (hydrolysing)
MTATASEGRSRPQSTPTAKGTRHKGSAGASRLRRVAVVTGTRAEFGLLETILRAMKARRHPELRLIVTGMHLLPKFGRTIDHIRAAGWRIDATVPMQTGSGDAADEAQAVARGIGGIARALDRLECDSVLVLGDRIEAFAGACAATCSRRILTHIHGGDRATGDVDDTLRNAISRMAHVHLVASKDAADRLGRMGEQRFRIHRVGAPGLDDIRQFRQADLRNHRPADKRVATLLGPVAADRFALVALHPCGRPARTEATTARRLVAAVEACGLAGVAVFPNSDPGHEGILEILAGLTDRPWWRVFPSLTRDDYIRVASRAAVMVGNSSSGIIESASLGLNAVDIGPRQKGRLPCGQGVLQCEDSLPGMIRSIRRAANRTRPMTGRSVYGDGHAGERIAEMLKRLIISPLVTHKELAY